MSSPGLSSEQHAALCRFAERNGRTWKSKLRAAWVLGTEWQNPGGDDGAVLRQIRNDFGPAWLDKAEL